MVQQSASFACSHTGMQCDIYIIWHVPISSIAWYLTINVSDIVSFAAAALLVVRRSSSARSLEDHSEDHLT